MISPTECSARAFWVHSISVMGEQAVLNEPYIVFRTSSRIARDDALDRVGSVDSAAAFC